MKRRSGDRINELKPMLTLAVNSRIWNGRNNGAEIETKLNDQSHIEGDYFSPLFGCDPIDNF